MLNKYKGKEEQVWVNTEHKNVAFSAGLLVEAVVH